MSVIRIFVLFLQGILRDRTELAVENHLLRQPLAILQQESQPSGQPDRRWTFPALHVTAAYVPAAEWRNMDIQVGYIGRRKNHVKFDRRVGYKEVAPRFANLVRRVVTQHIPSKSASVGQTHLFH
jgi:hypothetical protein